MTIRRFGGDAASIRYGWRDLYVLVPREGDGTVDGLEREIRSFAAETPAKRVGLVVHILPGTEPPSPAMRQRISGAMERLEPMMRCSAVWIEGAGFFASAFLAVGALMMRVRAHQFPRGLFHRGDELRRFLRQHLAAPAPTDAELITTFDWIRTDASARRSVGYVAAR